MFKSQIFRAVVENFIVAVIAYLLGYYFTAMFHWGTAEIGGLWAVISGVFVAVVMIVSVIVTDIGPVENATLRFVESVIGSLTAFAVAIAGVYIFRLKKTENK